VTRGSHFGARDLSQFDHSFSRRIREKVLVKLTRGPQNMTPEEVTKIVLNKIILNVWIENGTVL
jgi:hypothetical protein